MQKILLKYLLALNTLKFSIKLLSSLVPWKQWRRRDVVRCSSQWHVSDDDQF